MYLCFIMFIVLIRFLYFKFDVIWYCGSNMVEDELVRIEINMVMFIKVVYVENGGFIEFYDVDFFYIR